MLVRALESLFNDVDLPIGRARLVSSRQFRPSQVIQSISVFFELTVYSSISVLGAIAIIG